MPPNEFADRLQIALEAAGLTPEELDQRMRRWSWPGTLPLLHGRAPLPSSLVIVNAARMLGVSFLWLESGCLSPTAARTRRQVADALKPAALTQRQRDEVFEILERLP